MKNKTLKSKPGKNLFMDQANGSSKISITLLRNEVLHETWNESYKTTQCLSIETLAMAFEKQ